MLTAYRLTCGDELPLGRLAFLLLDAVFQQAFAGGLAEVPDQAGPAQGPQDVVAHVHFPPEEALVGGALVVVVVVVPALAEGDEGDEPVVAAVVGRGVASAAENVAQ